MTRTEYEATKRAQRRDTVLVLALVAVLGFYAIATTPDDAPAPTGHGYETCTTKEC